MFDVTSSSSKKKDVVTLSAFFLAVPYPYTLEHDDAMLHNRINNRGSSLASAFVSLCILSNQYQMLKLTCWG